jgi:hypothetical protein
MARAFKINANGARIVMARITRRLIVPFALRNCADTPGRSGKVCRVTFPRPSCGEGIAGENSSTVVRSLNYGAASFAERCITDAGDGSLQFSTGIPRMHADTGLQTGRGWRIRISPSPRQLQSIRQIA